MTLVLCPECRAEVSDRAVQCSQCGYPLAARSVSLAPAAGAEPRLQTYISPSFARAWTLGTVAVTLLMFTAGRGAGPGGAATLGILAVLASLIPIWWKARGGARAGAAPVAADLERRVEERLLAAEDEVRRRIAELEDSSRQITDLEERVDFAERLLTKYRDGQTPKP